MSDQSVRQVLHYSYKLERLQSDKKLPCHPASNDPRYVARAVPKASSPPLGELLNEACRNDVTGQWPDSVSWLQGMWHSNAASFSCSSPLLGCHNHPSCYIPGVSSPSKSRLLPPYLQQQVLPQCAADAAILQRHKLLLTLHQGRRPTLADQRSINVELCHVVYNHSHLGQQGGKRLGRDKWSSQPLLSIHH